MKIKKIIEAIFLEDKLEREKKWTERLSLEFNPNHISKRYGLSTPTRNKRG